jgi:hypothetical protein
MKKWSISLALKEMQVKTTVRFALTVRTQECKNIKNTTPTNAGKDGGWGGGIHCRWECKLVQPLWKTIWRLLKILKIIPSI